MRRDLVAILLVAVLGQIGGSDKERILMWAAPMLFVLAGRAIERPDWPWRRPLPVALLAAPLLLDLRVGQLLPIDVEAAAGPPVAILMPLGADVRLSWLLSYREPEPLRNLLILQWAGLGAALVWLTRPRVPRPRAGRDAHMMAASRGRAGDMEGTPTPGAMRKAARRCPFCHHRPALGRERRCARCGVRLSALDERRWWRRLRRLLGR
jgi:hypothetical protein